MISLGFTLKPGNEHEFDAFPSFSKNIMTLLLAIPWLHTQRVVLPKLATSLHLTSVHATRSLAAYLELRANDDDDDDDGPLDFVLVPSTTTTTTTTTTTSTSTTTKLDNFVAPLTMDDGLVLNGIGCRVRVIKLTQHRRLQQNRGHVEFQLFIETIERVRLVRPAMDKNTHMLLVHCEPLAMTSSNNNSNISLDEAALRQQSIVWIQAILSSLALKPQTRDSIRQVQSTVQDAPLADLVDFMANLVIQVSLASSQSARIAYAEQLNLLNCDNLDDRVHLLREWMKRLSIPTTTATTASLIKSRSTSSPPPVNSNNEDDQDDQNDLEDLRNRIKQASFPPHVQKVAQSQLKRYAKLNPMHAEHAVIRAYLDWLCDLPWDTSTHGDQDARLDLDQARRILDEDHYGLWKVKRRILEFLAVRKLTSRQQQHGGVNGAVSHNSKGRSPILCLVGPPGVGKTSLGKSIARALGRKFTRISLGGVRDVAEMKGHRRTYVGALPGLFIQAYKSVGVNNPVILLDEIDKMGRDRVHGDPSAALLEILDPEQNEHFTDHYLGVGFDLSRTVFIATANSLEGVSAPLLDRVEVVQLSGYTFEEKVRIARRHLLPKQVAAHGLLLDIGTGPNSGSRIVPVMEVSDEVLMSLARGYTRESGVRQLERDIAALCRYVASQLVKSTRSDSPPPFDLYTITHGKLVEILGPPRFEDDFDMSVPPAASTPIIQSGQSDRKGRGLPPGVVPGLSYVSTGSGSLLYIEAVCFPGSGRVHLTGSLGDVIKESAHMAISWIRANLSRLTTPPVHQLTDKTDVHIHFPSTSTPKDGPSAGLAICTALMSVVLNRPIRPGLAMTGEMTLSGRVLGVGGIREKVGAAERAGIEEVVLPERNRWDVDEMFSVGGAGADRSGDTGDGGEEKADREVDQVRRKVKLTFVESIDQVLQLALGPSLFRDTTPPTPLSATTSSATGHHGLVDDGGSEVGSGDLMRGVNGSSTNLLVSDQLESEEPIHVISKSRL